MPKAKLSIPRSRVRRKILLFFSDNQGSIDTPRGVATWTSESLVEVRKALEGLVTAGFLKAHRTSSTVAYSPALTPKELARVAARIRKDGGLGEDA
jgi:hypothetical protein